MIKEMKHEVSIVMSPAMISSKVNREDLAGFGKKCPELKDYKIILTFDNISEHEKLQIYHVLVPHFGF